MPGLLDHQFNFSGVTIGDGTDFPLYEVTGLDAPDVRDSDEDRFDRDGSVGGKHLFGKRIVTVRCDIAKANATDLETSLNTLRGAYKRDMYPNLEKPLYFKLPGMGERFVNARCTKRRIPVDERHARLNPEIVLEFRCPDPLQYAEALQTTTWSADATVQVLNNNGNMAMYPVIEMDATATSPLNIVNDTLGRQITINQTFSAGTLIVDLFKNTIKGDDGVDYYGNVNTLSKWWWLVPGNNSIRVVTNGIAARRVKWRHAWDGI